MLLNNKDRKILVITTRTGKIPWWQMAPSILTEHELVNVTAKGFDPPTNSHAMYLAHYNLFTNRSKIRWRLQQIDWDIIILDEGHRIKNWKNQWSKNIKKLKSKRRHIMTGTGFVNSPDEIWSLFNFLEPDRWSSYWRFRNRFCRMAKEYVMVRGKDGRMTRRPYTKVVGLAPGHRETFQRIVRSYGPRHTKAEVYKDLPALNPPTRIPVELNAVQRTMYDSIKKDLQLQDQQGSLILSPGTLSALTRMRQIAVATPQVDDDYYDAKLGRRKWDVSLVEPSAKLDALMDILDGLEWDDERRDQVAIFSGFTDPLELLKVRLDRAHITYIHMVQKDSDAERAAKVEAFQAGLGQVFLCTLALGSESITLTAASTVIFLDRSWSPAVNQQAISRVYGRGETRTVPPQIIHIEAKDTVDQRIEETLKHKASLFKALFGSSS